MSLLMPASLHSREVPWVAKDMAVCILALSVAAIAVVEVVAVRSHAHPQLSQVRLMDEASGAAKTFLGWSHAVRVSHMSEPCRCLLLFWKRVSLVQ